MLSSMNSSTDYRYAMSGTFEDLVISLFGCVFSTSNNEAKINISEALFNLGCKKPAVVLKAAHTYLIQNNKLNHQHRAVVLSTITKIIQKSSVVEQLEEQQILLIINLATQEMTLTKDANEECAEAAKDLLVTLGKHDKFVGNVMDALLLKFPPGLSSPPNKNVNLSIAQIAENNPFGFVPFLTDVLSRTAPLLSHLKQDSLKSAWAKSLSLFCESLVEFSSSNKQKEKDEPSQNEDQITPALIDDDLKQNYSDQMEQVYDVVFTWIHSKDYKTRADTAECIGYLCLIISKTKINRDLKKLVTSFLSLFKRITVPADQSSLTRGLANFLELCCSDETLPIDAYLDDIFNCLFGHVCSLTEQGLSTTEQPTSALNPLSIKIRNEAFRCFHVAARRFADKLVYYLLHKMQSEKDSNKIGATNLLRHLLNSAGPQMEDKRSLITMGLKPMLSDEQLAVRVKMSICQLCIALADHGYVQNEGGGEHVVKFLMYNLITHEDPNAVATNSAAKTTRQDLQASTQFHSQCSQALLTISKTCETAYELLWPYLFEFLCLENYTPVLGDICKCLRILIVRRKEADPEAAIVINTDENAKLPGPHQVFARLLVCLNGAALNPALNKRSIDILRLMKELSAWFSSTLVEVLPEQVDKLTTFLDELGTTDSSAASGPTSDYTVVALKCAKTQRWQSAILDLLEACIQAVVDGDWREKLAAALAQQLRLYINQPLDRCFLLRVIGFSLARVANIAFVVDHIYLAFRSANHLNQNERMGCGLMMGHAAQVHTELVLTELENISKWEHSKKSGGSLFTFIKEATYGRGVDSEDVVHLRATIVLSFGYVMLYCPTDLVIQRLEKTVLPFLRQYLANFKPESVIQEAHLDTINLIALTVHPSHLNSDYKFDQRFECLSYIKQYINSETPESLSTWVRLLGAKATASLARLEPPLSDNETWDIGNVLAKAIFPMCREKSGLKTPRVEHDFSRDVDVHSQRPPTVKTFHRTGSNNSVRSDDSADQREYFNFFLENEENSTMEATIAQYRSAICQIVLKKPIVQTVSQLLKMFQTFYGSASDHERIRSTETTVLILQVYLNNATDTKLGHASDFPPLCSILGRLAPRLADSVGSVRNAAVRSIWLAFRLSLLHGGHSPFDGEILDSKLFSVNVFINDYLNAGTGRVDSKVSKHAIKAISKEIESRLPPTQVQTYLSVLFKMLVDEQSNVGSGAAQLLATMLENRGHTLNTEAEMVFKTILENLPRVHAIDATYRNMLNAFRVFASHQQIIAIDALLQQSLPYSVQVKDVWKELSQESGQFYLIADYLLDLFGFPSMLTDTDSQCSDRMSTDSHASTHASSTNPTRKFFEIVDIGAGSNVKLVTSHLCSLLAALNEVVLYGEPESALIVRVPNFLASLFVSLTAIIDAQYPAVSKEPTAPSSKNHVITSELCRVTQAPVNLVVDALKTLVTRLQLHSLFDVMNANRSWTNLSHSHHYLSAITIFCRSFCDAAPELTLNLMKLLLERIKPEHTDSDRIASAAVLSSLITRCPDKTGAFDLELLRRTFQALSTALADNNLTVKKLALRGFSCTGTLVDVYSQSESSSAELFQDLANQAVNAAVSALEDSTDQNDQLSVEAVNTLESLVFVLKRPILEEILPKMLLKIKPCFEKNNIALRIVAFSLFGKLSLRVGHSDIYREALHSNIVSVLLHLNDLDPEVKTVCAKSLKNFESAFTSPHVINLIQKELASDGPMGKYVTFLQDFSTVLVVSYSDRANYYIMNCCNYFKSQSANIRANAAYMAGFLVEALTPELRQTISKDVLFTGFSHLLSDQDSQVRCAAASATVSMSNFADEDVPMS